MIPSEAKLIRILTASPKCWRELLPDFPNRHELNDSLLQCEKRGEIVWRLQDGLYHVRPATETALESTQTDQPILPHHSTWKTRLCCSNNGKPETPSPSLSAASPEHARAATTSS